MADDKKPADPRMLALDISNPAKFILGLRDLSDSDLNSLLNALSEVRDSVNQCGKGVIAEMERRVTALAANADAEPDPLKREILKIVREISEKKDQTTADQTLANLPVGDNKTWH